MVYPGWEGNPTGGKSAGGGLEELTWRVSVSSGPPAGQSKGKVEAAALEKSRGKKGTNALTRRKDLRSNIKRREVPNIKGIGKGKRKRRRGK